MGVPIRVAEASNEYYYDAGNRNTARRDGVEIGGGGGDNGGMETRVKALEDAMLQVRQDVAVMRSNYVTKADLSDVRGELKSEIANARSSIILWVVGTVVLAQLLPALPALLRALGWIP